MAAPSLTSFARWSQTTHTLHDLITTTAALGGVDTDPDRIACDVILAIQRAYPNWRAHLTAPLSTATPPPPPAPDNKEEAAAPPPSSVPVEAPQKKDPLVTTTLTMRALIETALADKKDLSPFVRAAMLENADPHVYLSEKLQAHSSSVIDDLCWRIGKFESRTRDYGALSFNVDGHRVILVRYGDYGNSAITNAILAQWPAATDIAFHTNLAALDMDTIEFKHFYRCYKSSTLFGGGLYIERYTFFG